MAYGHMRWANTLFVHWRVEPAAIEACLPDGLGLDRYHGRAFLGLVALDTVGPMPHPLLRSPLARLFSYQQLNLRTYVVGAAGPGMFLLETRVDRPTFALGARLLGMPYRLDRRLSLRVAEGAVALRAHGIALAGGLSDLGPSTLESRALERFLLDRSWTYGQLPGGRLYAVRMDHPPWRVRAVHFEEPPSPAPFGFAPPAEPAIAQLADETVVRIAELAMSESASAAAPSLEPA